MLLRRLTLWLSVIKYCRGGHTAVLNHHWDAALLRQCTWYPSWGGRPSVTLSTSEVWHECSRCSRGCSSAKTEEKTEKARWKSQHHNSVEVWQLLCLNKKEKNKNNMGFFSYSGCLWRLKLPELSFITYLFIWRKQRTHCLGWILVRKGLFEGRDTAHRHLQMIDNIKPPLQTWSSALPELQHDELQVMRFLYSLHKNAHITFWKQTPQMQASKQMVN